MTSMLRNLRFVHKNSKYFSNQIFFSNNNQNYLNNEFLTVTQKNYYSTLNEETKKRIEGLVNKNDLFLFMKGTPEAPQCGFSNAVIRLLNTLDVDFESFDVLSDEEIREGVKIYSDWPTIPQLYIKQEFVGGCDIVIDLFKSGELEKMIPSKEGRDKRRS
eukprot:TRINITY_DN66169_c0_g1_i2.p1 TRINITY_DN66169_c0_g1~~TRINITY_DN66169_c0_g1_i2.p1  ORF type:complete len:170 (+),score=26.86 TRINITY_DN66169_c0_g1_i2:32-511(+)